MVNSSKWQTTNGAVLPHGDPTSAPFKMIAPPETDIWRRSDESDVFSAPIIYQSLPSKAFKSVSVTVFAPWKTQYDQGGLLLAFPGGGREGEPRKWIKAGIEYHDLECVLGVVGTDRYSDWSLAPMHKEYHQKASFRFERKGSTLWVYVKQEGMDGELKPMREVKWAFLEGRLEEELWVGVYAAKPTVEGGGEEEAEKGIEVSFEDLVVERED